MCAGVVERVRTREGERERGKVEREKTTNNSDVMCEKEGITDVSNTTDLPMLVANSPHDRLLLTSKSLFQPQIYSIELRYDKTIRVLLFETRIKSK